MQWLSQNYQWLFDGVGGAALLAIIGFGVHFLRKSSRKPKWDQHSSVSNVPLASGSDINQAVNTHIIHHAESVTFVPAPIAAPSPVVPHQVRPNPNMVAVNARISRVSETSRGVWSEGFPPHHDAFIVQFANEARSGARNVGAPVRAQLIYSHGGVEVRRLTGCWLDQAADMTDFRVDDNHNLMVGIMLGGQFTTVGKRRIRVALDTDEIPSDITAIPDFQHGTVYVRLTHAHSGDVLYEGLFSVNTHPLEIEFRLMHL